MADPITTVLATQIDGFTEQTRDPDWCQDLAEYLAPLIARRCSTEAVLDDVRTARRHRDDATPLPPAERLQIQADLVDQLTTEVRGGLPVETSYALLVSIAAAAVEWAETLTTTDQHALTRTGGDQ